MLRLSQPNREKSRGRRAEKRKRLWTGAKSGALPRIRKHYPFRNNVRPSRKTKKRLELLFAEVVTGVACSRGGIFRGENFSFGVGVRLRSAIGTQSQR